VLPSNRWTLRMALILMAVALAPLAAAAAGADAPGFDRPLPQDLADGGPRNRAAEAATGDIDAMREVVQDIVDCLRAQGFHPGDPEVVHGDSVIIADWSPGWDSAADRATHECAFPTR
jgi:hypothetical protein